jgi:hypothetical protein
MNPTLPLGIWLKQGYPELFVVEAQQVTRYYFIEDVALVYKDKDTLERVSEEIKTITKIGNELNIQFWDVAAPYTFEKLANLPELPLFGETQGWNQDIALNFEALWSLLKKHFAFSQERNLLWDGLYEAERAKALACTSPEELFDTMAQLLSHLQDGHSGLAGAERKTQYTHLREAALYEAWFPVRRDTAINTKDGRGFEKDMWRYVKESILEGQGQALRDVFVWGRLEQNLGYIGFHECFGFAGDDDAATATELRAAQKVIEQALHDLKDTTGLIIDARFNPGGLDVVSLLFAGHFTKEPRLVFRKHEVVEGQAREAHDVLVSPVATYYPRPVVFLTSAYTCSAAEIALMAFRVLPTVTIMGQVSNGALSDSMSFVLPNGWKGRLSNEVYIAADGQQYEGLGIPPEMTTPDPSAGDFWQRVEATLTMAKQHLSA